MKFSVVATFAACALAAPVEKRQVSQVLTIVQSLYDQATQYTGAINSTLSGVNLPIADGVKDQVTEQVAGQIKSITSLVDGLLEQTKDLTDLTKGLDSVTGGLTSAVNGATGAATEGKQNGGLPLVGSLGGLGGVTSITKNLPVVGSLGGITSITKNLPVVGSLGVGKRQVDTSAVTDVVTKLVTEVTSTIGGVNKTEGLGDLTSSIQPLGKSISTLLGDLDNIVGGVISTVTNVLKALGLEVEVGLLNLDVGTKEKSS